MCRGAHTFRIETESFNWSTLLNRFMSASAPAQEDDSAPKMPSRLLKPLAGRVVAKLEPIELSELWGSDANVAGHAQRQRLQLWGGHLEPASDLAAHDPELLQRFGAYREASSFIPEEDPPKDELLRARAGGGQDALQLGAVHPSMPYPQGGQRHERAAGMREPQGVTHHVVERDDRSPGEHGARDVRLLELNLRAFVPAPARQREVELAVTPEC